jgi:hypothetical protein
MKYIHAFMIIICAFVLTSCPDTENNAVEVTVSEVADLPGYEWFAPKFNEFVPIPAKVASISTAFNSNTMKFVVLAKPSCSCENNVAVFPQIMKTLVESGVADTCFRIFSMRDKYSNTPYKVQIAIKELPEVYLLKSNSAVYSITDSLRMYQSIYPDSAFFVEDFILNSLK